MSGYIQGPLLKTDWWKIQSGEQGKEHLFQSPLKYHLWEHSVQDTGGNITKTVSVLCVDHLNLSVRKKYSDRLSMTPELQELAEFLEDTLAQKTLCIILIASSNKQLAKPWIRTPPGPG